jgi:hypothetical protein
MREPSQGQPTQQDRRRHPVRALDLGPDRPRRARDGDRRLDRELHERLSIPTEPITIEPA